MAEKNIDSTSTKEFIYTYKYFVETIIYYIPKDWDDVRHFFPKVLRRIKLNALKIPRRYKDKKKCTYSLKYSTQNLHLRLQNFSENELTPLSEAHTSVINNFLSHKFDLLGSGWAQFKYGQLPTGIENIRYLNHEEIDVDQRGNWLKGKINSSNLCESISIWEKISFPYLPIDWQVDIKSGYRWSENNWSRDIKLVGPLGSDIKVPWELARMQHLSQLAIYYSANKDNKDNNSNIDVEEIPREFRNQILDFIATNPPRYGANWVCTMDVAIRAANWLIAYDLFFSSGVKFDASFNKLFTRSIYEHGQHIANNLEWSVTARNNHYLANIVGLIFISCYLSNTPETNIWLAFSIQEFIEEISHQFHADGTNFEASTSYHRLSTQMIIYGAALLSNLPSEKKNMLSKYDSNLWKHSPGLMYDSVKFFKFRNYEQLTPLPDWVYDRIELAAYFTRDITKPNGLIPMIGDNDSGYFIKFFPNYSLLTCKEWHDKYNNSNLNICIDRNELVVDEEQRCHLHIQAELTGLFGQSICESNRNESLITAILSGHNSCGKKYTPSLFKNNFSKYADEVQWSEFESKKNNQEWVCKSYAIQLPGRIETNNISIQPYEGMGIYIFTTKNLYLLIRCGEVGQEGIAGHAHNDQLSLELNFAGEDIIVDPGSYVYTPFTEIRNTYRSVNAHFAPKFIDEEPSNLGKGLFTLKNAKPGVCLYFSNKGFIGMHEGYSSPVYRRIEIRSDDIIVNDLSKSHKLKSICHSPPLISPRYGIQLRSKSYSL